MHAFEGNMLDQGLWMIRPAFTNVANWRFAWIKWDGFLMRTWDLKSQAF